MPDLEDGERLEVQGSGSSVYELRNVGGVYSCSCPAWRNQSTPHTHRTCKHLRRLRGEEAEQERVGTTLPAPAKANGENGPPLLLAHSWDQLTDLTGWWMSEKLDGVRAYWDGRRFLSRLGNAFVTPDWFVRGLPDHPLDGELWGGRRMFQRTVSIVRRQDASQQWQAIRYVVFDAPDSQGSFEERLELCRGCLTGGPEHLQVLEHERCQGLPHLRSELGRIEAEGGEGLMLRRPGSRYEVGRSSSLLKVKSFHDAEATVIGYQPGEGRHKGRLGALQVELADGTKFSVGTGFSDAERAAPPPLGSQITFRYQELSEAGVPRFPSYVGVRLEAAPPAPRAAPAPRPVETPVAQGYRRFEFVEGTSSKFWEVATEGCLQTVRFGRMGTAGQSKTKTFASAAEAQRDTEKLTAEKLSKGYQER